MNLKSSEHWYHEHIIWVRQTLAFIMLGLALFAGYIYFIKIPHIARQIKEAEARVISPDLPKEAYEWDMHKSKAYGIMFSSPRLFTVIGASTSPEASNKQTTVGTFVRKTDNAERAGLLRLSTYPGTWNSLDDIEVSNMKADVEAINKFGASVQPREYQVVYENSKSQKLLSVYDPNLKTVEYIFLKGNQAFVFSYDQVNYSYAEMQVIAQLVMSISFEQ
ncbi:MAG: hypothetical protein V4519_04590 [Patescibacteria group bacterium]